MSFNGSHNLLRNKEVVDLEEHFQGIVIECTPHLCTQINLKLFQNLKSSACL